MEGSTNHYQPYLLCNLNERCGEIFQNLEESKKKIRELYQKDKRKRIPEDVLAMKRKILFNNMLPILPNSNETYIRELLNALQPLQSYHGSFFRNFHDWQWNLYRNIDRAKIHIYFVYGEFDKVRWAIEVLEDVPRRLETEIELLWYNSIYRQNPFKNKDSQSMTPVDRYRARKRFPCPTITRIGGKKYGFSAQDKSLMASVFKVTPKPKRPERQRLADETGLTIEQVTNYFKNRRQRSKGAKNENDSLKKPETANNKLMEPASPGGDIFVITTKKDVVNVSNPFTIEEEKKIIYRSPHDVLESSQCFQSSSLNSSQQSSIATSSAASYQKTTYTNDQYYIHVPFDAQEDPALRIIKDPAFTVRNEDVADVNKSSIPGSDGDIINNSCEDSLGNLDMKLTSYDLEEAYWNYKNQVNSVYGLSYDNNNSNDCYFPRSFDSSHVNQQPETFSIYHPCTS